jgi:hypothetical protein
MSSEAERILESLAAVGREREARQAEPALHAQVEAVKAYQQSRFRRSYADLLASTRYAPAAGFFLEELYGPGDFSQRDAQFARIVPALVRLFPEDIVVTVRVLGELHALSERLDTAMARAMCQGSVGRISYLRAWQAVGEATSRELQIELILDVGRALERYTRNPVLRHSLKLMRGPASAAGLGTLQSFLERGFDSFRAMKGSDDFLRTIAARERALCERLFSAPEVDALDPPAADPLAQLP